MRKLAKLLRSQRGAELAEYILMLAVVVGVVLVVGRVFKAQIGGVFDNVMRLITGATNTLGSGNN